ncbi:DUF6765 family protein [Desulfoscipio sp. XC116]|uniref:DUF6765 family protein n=1 Tax=Desulfoscipio sp. XC116 TaxID=3144975 RepID=UPI00325AAD94
MDINFHYYAVKAVARKAGFDEAEAQAIASFSQYVDDFTDWVPFFTRNVPEWARSLATNVGFGYMFHPATTGFNSMATLAREGNQKWIVAPFHFIPSAPLNTLLDYKNYRVAPAYINVPSLISNMLEEARLELAHPAAARPAVLMKIGMLLHIFADTYSHQRFSGFWSWVNHSKLTSVIENDDAGADVDITASYSPDDYYKITSIGHANVNHAPDDSNVRFSMLQKAAEGDGEETVPYTRSNTADFIDAAEQIMIFLRNCRGLPPIVEAEWGPFRDRFRLGLLTALKETAALGGHWHGIFPEYEFHYEKDTLLQGLAAAIPLEGEARRFSEAHGIEPQLRTATSDTYFRYNVIADQIRRMVVGEVHAPGHVEELRAEARAVFGAAAPANSR